MGLTDEQRRRIEENRARARDRLREKRLGQNLTDAGTSGGGVDAAGGPSDMAGGSIDPTVSAPRDGGGRSGADRSLPGEDTSGVREGPGSGGAGSGEKGERGTRAGGGGGRGGGGGHGDGSTRGGGGVRGGGEPPALSAAESCEGCRGAEGDGRVDQELLQGFGVSVCRTCKLSREEFQCVPKKEAKEAYLLPEGTIAVLKFIERDNPRHASWTKMKLYLRRDVAGYSYKRWGGEDGLAKEKSRRDALKYDRSLARTKDVFKRGRSTTEDSGFRGGFLDDFDDDR